MVIFDRNTKRLLYLKGKRFEDYNCVRADAKGVFTKHIPPKFDWESYEKSKDEYIEQLGKEDESNENSYKKQRNRIIRNIKKKFDLTNKQLVDIVDLSERQISSITKK